jgi:hypothetical protein
MISLFTHYSGLREYVGTETDTPPFDGTHKRWISSDGDTINVGDAIVTPPSEGGKK